MFLIRINTAAQSEATFTLQYEELLFRDLSKFQQTLNLNPGSVVDDFQVTVRAVDDQGIVYTGASDYVSVGRVSGEEVVFTYSPSPEEQDDTENGLARDMVVEFDVNHPSDGAGLIVVNDCYFAQFFSPSGIEAVPVDLVFVIDVSGSMSGQKIDQTREALETIINDLRPQDRFSMVTFASAVGYWINSLVSVSEYRQQAIQFARGLIAGGSTNFNEGLLAGADILKADGNPDYVQLLVILTDGQPSFGEVNTENIVQNAKIALAGTHISLNCLGFGFDLNFDLLERLALSNNGIVRRVYLGEDAATQLEGFFAEISSPILREIVVTYEEGSVSTITDTNFPLLFNGSELIVAGRFTCDNPQTITVRVTGTGVNGEIMFESQVETGSSSSISGFEPHPERLAAYLFIQQLLERRIIAASQAEIDTIEQEALELALEYNFVTELTSLIVIEENGEMGNFSRGEGGGGEDGLEEDGNFLGAPTAAGTAPPAAGTAPPAASTAPPAAGTAPPGAGNDIIIVALGSSTDVIGSVMMTLGGTVVACIFALYA